MNPSCRRAFFCEEEGNRGFFISCPESAPYINIDFSMPIGYSCSATNEACPGSFHFGCDGAWANVTFTPPATTTTTEMTTPTWGTTTSSTTSTTGSVTDTSTATTTSGSIRIHTGFGIFFSLLLAACLIL